MTETRNLKDTETHQIPDSPLFIIELEEPEFDLKGWVVIHSVGEYGSCGGIRVYPDINIHELKLLAKAMTYKYSFFMRKTGGAKGGLRIPFDLSPAERRMALKNIGSHMAPIIKSGVYHPWTDMNFSIDDLKCIYEGAGIRAENMGDSSYYTALSTFAGIKASAEYYGIAPENCRITIEGAGNVGKHLAREIVRWGGKVIGASTRSGAVVNLSGIDIDAMMQAHAVEQDNWVNGKGNWDAVSNDELFSLPMDIHVPCARILSLTEHIASKIKARVVVPAANVPCTADGESRLSDRGISLLPDFVINGGGVVGTSISDLGKTDKEVRDFFFKDFRDMVIRLLKLSEQKQQTPIHTARNESNRCYAAKGRPISKHVKLFKKAVRALRWRGLIPKSYIRRRSFNQLLRITNEKFN